MNNVDDLATWLRAQLDDDERVATEAANRYPHWDATSDGNVVQVNTGGSGYIAAGPWDGDLFEIGVHMARHDPARVLAEVDAKRRILGEHNIEYPGEAFQYCRVCHDRSRHDAASAPCPTMRLLALPYAGRDGYRPEWAPDA